MGGRFHRNTHRAAMVTAADHLNDGFPRTIQLVVEPGIAATGGFQLKAFFHPGEQVFCGSPPGLQCWRLF
jgi:hypothetical protein